MVFEYNQRLQRLAANKSLSDKEFQVVYQPGFAELPIAKYKQGYLSGIDWYKKENMACVDFLHVPYVWCSIW